ncbi:MAG: hypothetical protein C9356_14870 [Oleiphilus sp.]|nr:MAG: hypothetical protein C9356_14870 [Oleiphilus sp.]
MMERRARSNEIVSESAVLTGLESGYYTFCAPLLLGIAFLVKAVLCVVSGDYSTGFPIALFGVPFFVLAQAGRHQQCKVDHRVSSCLTGDRR